METNGVVTKTTPHLAILPTPGMGHLIPLAELAKWLVAHHDFTLTFITLASSASKAQSAFLAALPPSISSVALPPVPLDDLPPDARVETIMSVSAARSVPALRDVLRDLQSSTNLVAFLTDLFGADTFDAPKQLGIPHYMFFPSNLLLLSLFFHLPTLDATTTCEYRDLPGPLELPGCVPVPGPDLLHPIQDRSNECYKWIVHHGRRYREAEGILVNTFDAIEPGAAKILREKEPGRPPVYPIGPLVQTGSPPGMDGSECLRWLDMQPHGSVLFVSFGSGGTLLRAQLVELALGLEMSGQRFLWVVRSPSDSGETSGSYFSAQSKGDPFAFLPEGFVSRTKDRGLVVPSWAPQVEVLAHGATAGFLMHCGWNSTLESVVNGVPMIAWPLYAEQRQNAVMLVEGVKAALRPKEGEDGLIGREEIARVAKELMEGEEGKRVRSRVKELQEAAIKGLQDDGLAYKTLTEVAQKWKGSNPV
ncbi:hydroquinone glucosyltransferase-like [Phoenix dactylifera]|uniref:Glycosyltransferase n=1 Tax=Phoenix dactylifera TaxID=42345 RepID=A0A8B7C425_PHODC|nr:hydroquinone glucosyltransferase-like [Phoenix dactylifera]